MKRKLGTLGAAVTLWQLATAVREHWLSIPLVRRERVTELVTRSRLRPSTLSTAEQAELRELFRGMDLLQLGRQLAAIAVAKRRGR